MSTPSSFEIELQRRLRAVLAARTGKTVPDGMVVEVSSEPWAGNELTGDIPTVELTLHGRLDDLAITHEDEGTGGIPEYDPVARLLADVLAVPDSPEQRQWEEQVAEAIKDARALMQRVDEERATYRRELDNLSPEAKAELRHSDPEIDD